MAVDQKATNVEQLPKQNQMKPNQISGLQFKY